MPAKTAVKEPEAAVPEAAVPEAAQQSQPEPLDILTVSGWSEMLEAAPPKLREYLVNEQLRDAERQRLAAEPEPWEGFSGLVAVAEQDAAAKDAEASALQRHWQQEYDLFGQLSDKQFVAVMKSRQPDSAYPVPGREPAAPWLVPQA
jgi:hypothetical protein